MRRSEALVVPGEPDPTALRPGDTITVNWGKEIMTPIRYHSCEIGPFSATTTIREGENANDARSRAWRWLDDSARKLFREKMGGHLERVKMAAESATTRR